MSDHTSSLLRSPLPNAFHLIHSKGQRPYKISTTPFPTHLSASTQLSAPPLPLLQPCQPPFCSINMVPTLLSQDLCSCCTLCLEHSSPSHPQVSISHLHPFKYPFRETFADPLFQITIPLSPTLLLYFSLTFSSFIILYTVVDTD